MSTHSTQKALTLVEIVISMAIFVMVLGFMYSAYYSGADLWQVNTEETDLESRARLAMALMTSELKSATRSSAENPSPNLYIPSKPNNNDIHFYLPDSTNGTPLTDANGGLTWDTNNQIKYQYIPGQNELRRLEKGVHTILARDVTDVSFIDASIDSAVPLSELRINLTMRAVTPRNRTITHTVKANVRLRN